MTNKQRTSVLVLLTGAIILPFLITSNTAYGESFIPPVPDKTKTLLANDGGSDGCNSSRFECVLDGDAVLDKQTGLTWTRITSFANKVVPWQEAVTFCQNLDVNGQKGWRLPSRDELISLLDTTQSNPAFSEGHPFENPMITSLVSCQASIDG